MLKAIRDDVWNRGPEYVDGRTVIIKDGCNDLSNVIDQTKETDTVMRESLNKFKHVDRSSFMYLETEGNLTINDLTSLGSYMLNESTGLFEGKINVQLNVSPDVEYSLGGKTVFETPKDVDTDLEPTSNGRSYERKSHDRRSLKPPLTDKRNLKPSSNDENYKSKTKFQPYGSRRPSRRSKARFNLHSGP